MNNSFINQALQCMALLHVRAADTGKAPGCTDVRGSREAGADLVSRSRTRDVVDNREEST